MSYEDLQKERDSLLAQHISATQEQFVPPCLKCIERESANSSPECSNALAESLQRLHTKYDTLQDHHNTLLSDHEKLSYELLQRKQDLEKLRVSYEDLPEGA